MGEGITPEQFKILSELRKEAKATVKVEYVEILKSNWLKILAIQCSEPCKQYYIVFKLNGQEHTVQIDKHEYMIALKKGCPPKTIAHIRDTIADQIGEIFLKETL